MKFGYKFSNLFGEVHSQGNLLFTPDGNSVLSAVGNRVSVFDLVNNVSYTLPCECSRDVDHMALSPNGLILLMVDVEGRAILVSFPRRVLLYRFNFKAPVKDIKFSPCGLYFAVTHKRQVHVYRTPEVSETKEFAPFLLHRKYVGHFQDVTCLDWSHDSKYFVTGSKDATARIYTLDPLPGYTPVSLTAHKDKLVGVFFAHNSMDIYTTSKDGTLLVWKSRWEEYNPKDDESDKGEENIKGEENSKENESSMDESDDKQQSDTESSSDDEGSENEEVIQHPRWSLAKDDRHYFLQDHAKLITSTIHKPSNLLIAGFSNGIFGLYELPDFNNIHTLSISTKRITAACVNATGEWLALGCSKLGQLLVWEWQSETYVLKQQGHHYDMNCVAYSPDGQMIATGGEDGKVKLWNSLSGFCVITFTEHTGAITGLTFAQNGMSILSSSLDGTVRAFDLMRYRNFRTFTSPEPTQFSSMAIDPSGEIVVAGCQDSFQICVWSMKSGQLVDMLAGHEGPVATLHFNPIRSLLASGSWDNTVRLWDIFEHKRTRDTLELASDVISLAFRSDGRELTTSTLNGNLTIWDVSGPASQLRTIEGRKDLAGGRLTHERVTAKHADASKCFTNICYSADGSCLLAGGNTKYVCIYEVSQAVLLKRICISNNRSLDGTLQFLNSKDMTDAGPMALIDADSDSDVEDRLDTSLPGSVKGDFSTRRARPEVRTKDVQFSPTGRSFAAASTAGLLIYSLDDSIVFDPSDLDLDITPDNIRKVLQSQEYITAVIMSLRLNEEEVICEVLDAIPSEQVQLVAQSVPPVYTSVIFSVLAKKIDQSQHLEYYLQWARHFLNAHGLRLKDQSSRYAVGLRAILKSLQRKQEEIGTLCGENGFALGYLLKSMKMKKNTDFSMESLMS
eukprot:m.24578 g.24578  ORF g.24578 m.24578 type:complete len:904 (-) comp7619_c0_seq2:59-2770(-)